MRLIRWVFTGIILSGLTILYYALFLNKRSQQKVGQLAWHTLLKEKIEHLQEEKEKILLRANKMKLDIKEKSQLSNRMDKKIQNKIVELEKGLERLGMPADEISKRINNLSV